jgi:hypothetical protein
MPAESYNAPMADASVEQLLLTELRQEPDWPAELDALASQAAAIGRLSEAHHRAMDRTMRETQSSATFHTFLLEELHAVLGR